jgi:putative flippase GtrA
MSLSFNNQKERKRFIKFAIVGAIGAVIDFGVFNFLTGIFELKPILASVVSFSTAVVSNFLWNRYWTYPDSRSKTIHIQLFQFATINIIGLLIRTPVFAVLETPLPVIFARLGFPNEPWFDPEFLGHNAALAIAVVVVMFWNFFVNRHLTYNDVD